MFNFIDRLPNIFIKKPFAHRGFHDCNGSFTKGSGPENSRESIFHAIKNGLGIEIDVRFTKDYVPVVIHDDYLKRLCGVDSYLSNYNYNETKLLKLKNNERLPTLSDILSIVDGNTPILIEFKKLNKTQDYKFFNSELYSLLKKYLGPIALMSFDLRLITYLKKKLPNIQRGLVLEKYDYNKKIYSSNFEKIITENQMQKNEISFVSFEYSKLTKEFYNINKTKKRNVIAWTINSKLDAKKMKNFCDNITFEGFKPI
ncbi:MAG: glycerophosphodiester phosphodiesterase family protein [Paracoccaceae bacterium]